MKRVAVLFCLGFGLAGCGHSATRLSDTRDSLSQGGSAQGGNHQNNDVNLSVFSDGCPSFLEGRVVGLMASEEIIENSGMVASRNNSGVFWVHNDSGDGPRIFAVNTAGTLLGIYTLQGAEAQDWEDNAMGPGPNANQDYLYMGDIGSGGSLPITIYRVPEPTVNANQPLVTTTIPSVDRIDLTYPDGDDYDAEVLFVEPANGNIYIVTKTGDRSLVFRKQAPHQNGQTAVLEQVATLNFTSLPGNHQATAGDMSPQGDVIVIRTYSHAFIWKVAADGDVARALGSGPCATIDLVDEPQGEAIAFTPEGNLVTTSESTRQPIYLYQKE